MTRFVQTYPYLMLSLTMLGIFLLALARSPRQVRGFAALSGLLAAPFALTSFLVVPEYWRPVRIAEFLAGPEDIIFTFASAGTAYLLAA